MSSFSFNERDYERIRKAQTYNGEYCSRKWIKYAAERQYTPDDICHVMSMSCTLLHAMHMDKECDKSLRSIALAEQQDRRKYGLPPDGCDYVEAIPERNKKAQVVRRRRTAESYSF